MKAPEDRGKNRKDELPIDETQRLIASDKVEGTHVFDPQGQGTGDRAELHGRQVHRQGRLRRAQLRRMGLGLGERYHALPWKTLHYDTELSGYVIKLTREQLQRAPSYKAADSPCRTPIMAGAFTTITMCPGTCDQ